MEKQSEKTSAILYENCNPNQQYSLLYVSSGEEILLELGEELITDGDISDMTHTYNETGNIYRRGSAVITIKNASYAIVQQLADRKVATAEIFTTIVEEAKLNKLMDIANVRQGDNGEFLLTKCPYVRKIKL